MDSMDAGHGSEADYGSEAGFGSEAEPIQSAVEAAMRACGIVILDGRNGHLPHQVDGHFSSDNGHGSDEDDPGEELYEGRADAAEQLGETRMACDQSFERLSDDHVTFTNLEAEETRQSTSVAGCQTGRTGYCDLDDFMKASRQSLSPSSTLPGCVEGSQTTIVTGFHTETTVHHGHDDFLKASQLSSSPLYPDGMNGNILQRSPCVRLHDVLKDQRLYINSSISRDLIEAELYQSAPRDKNETSSRNYKGQATVTKLTDHSKDNREIKCEMIDIKVEVTELGSPGRSSREAKNYKQLDKSIQSRVDKKERKERKRPHVCEKCGRAFHQKVHLQKHLLSHSGDFPLRCRVCNKGYRQPGSLIIHMKSFHPTEEIQGNGCMPRGVTEEDQGKQEHVYDKCGKDLPTSCHLKEHLTIHTDDDHTDQNGESLKGKKKFVKKSHVFEDRYKPRVVRRGKEENRHHVCNKCGKGFLTASHLKEHLVVHTGLYPLICKVCNKGFLRTRFLDEHKKCHHDKSRESSKVIKKFVKRPKAVKEVKRPHVCPYCAKAFRLRIHVKEHVMIHTGEYPLKCEVCDKGFRRPTELKLHRQRYHAIEDVMQSKETSSSGQQQETPGQNDRLDNPEDSNGVFTAVQDKGNKLEMEKHKKHTQSTVRTTRSQKETPSLNSKLDDTQQASNVSTQKNGYKPKSVKQKETTKSNKPNSELQQQKTTHRHSIASDTGQTSYVCEDGYKPRVVRRGKEENRHHVCNKCGKGFLTASHLKEHLIVHTGLYPLRCKVCNKGFLRTRFLDEHEKRHHDKSRESSKVIKKVVKRPKAVKEVKRPHACAYCGKAFRLRIHVKEHVMIHTGVYPLKCEVCDKGFRRPTELKLHRQRYHATEEAMQSEETHSSGKQQEMPCQNDVLDVPGDSNGVFTAVQDKGNKLEMEKHKKHTQSAVQTTSSQEETLSQHSKLDETMQFSNVSTHKKGYKPKSVKQKETIQSNKPDSEIEQQKKSQQHNEMDDTEQTSYVCENENKPRVVRRGKEQNRCHLCDKCGKGFVRMDTLKEHLITHTGLYPLRCKVCNQGFQRVRFLNEHTKRHHDQNRKSSEENKKAVKKPHVCPYCGKAFRLRIHVKEHVITHTGVYPLKCEVCDKGFRRPKELQRHKSVYHGIVETAQSKKVEIRCKSTITRVNNEIQCYQCGEAFKALKSFRSHDCEQRRKVCSECGRSFSTVSGCILHRKTHFRSQNVFPCTFCNKTFKYKCLLQGHVDGYHADNPKHTCHICGKGMWHRATFYSHMRVHKGYKRSRSHQCTVCPKAYRSPGDLRAHMARHTGNYEFTCPTCGKRFGKVDNLRLHERMHTGEKPFACEKCHQNFARRKTLNDHMRRHTGEKPHKCAVCDKAFAQSAGLYSHMKVHSKKKLK